MYIYVHRRANVAPGLKPRWTINTYFITIFDTLLLTFFVTL